MHLTSPKLKKTVAVFFIIAGSMLICQHSSAQYFGRNHVQYERFDFKVLETNHYDIYYYDLTDSTLFDFALMSERWYERHQQVLHDTLAKKNPIFIYKNHSDFSQTTLMSQNIGIGTGGVTEGYKNRVFMPFFESNKQTDHVLGHELVHAFQYNILKSGDSDSLSLYSAQNIPLWMIEGMAEYLSVGSKDGLTAMWMRDAVVSKDFPTLKDLTETNKYFPYRYGQAFWAYIGGLYGDKFIKPLFLTTAKYGYRMAVDSVLGYDETVISDMWEKRTTEYYSQFMSDTISVIGDRLLSDDEAGDINISPLLSPDGKYTVFYSEKNLFSIDLFLAETATGRVIRVLNSATQRAHIDNYNYIESSATWSPDGEKLAYPVFSKGDNLIIVVDVSSGNTLRQIKVPGVEYFNYLAWSPDGGSMLIAGLVDAHSDLFLYDLNTGEVKELTNDGFSEIHATWSPDGKTIAFSSDRGEDTNLEKLKFGSYKINLLDMESGAIKTLNFFPGADNLNPQFSADGKSIYFLSNSDGFRNLFEYRLDDGSLAKLTKYFTGISGITPLAPALSVARKSDELAYVIFRGGNYHIHTAKTSDFTRYPVDAQTVNFAPLMLPPVENYGTDIIAQNLHDPSIPPRVDIDNFLKKPYKPKFSLTTIQQSGVGIGVGSYGGGGGTFTGLAGGVAALFGDVLNRNQIYGVLSVNGEIYDFGGQVSYLNRSSRINYGAGIGHIPYKSTFLGYSNDTLDIGGRPVPTITQDIYNYRTFIDQANIFTSFPISQTLRWEASGTFSHYSYRVDRIRFHYQDLGNFIGGFIGQEKEKLEAPDGFNLFSGQLAFVGDNASFGITGPVKGRRFRFEVGKTFGRLDTYTLMGDYRKYFYGNPFTVALRGMYYGRRGKDSNNNLIYPYFIGYEYFVRGYNYNSMTDSKNIPPPNSGELTIDNLQGNELSVFNIEFRLPLTGPEKLAQIKSGFLFSDLIVFFDAGKAWNYTSNSRYSNIPAQVYGFDDNPIVTSAGASLRINLFGFAIVEPYVAYPFQRYNADFTFGLYLSGGGF